MTMKTKQEQIDEMVKVIKGFDICGLFGSCFSTGADGENTRYITCPECFAEALYNAGYRKIENANGHNLPHEIDYLLTEFDEMGFVPTSLCDNPEGKAKLWKSALVYEIGLLLDEYAAIKEKAVKEFAEKIKAKSYVNNYCREVVEIDKIDELLKEYENGKDKD